MSKPYLARTSAALQAPWATSPPSHSTPKKHSAPTSAAVSLQTTMNSPNKFGSSVKAEADKWLKGLGRVHAVNGYALRIDPIDRCHHPRTTRNHPPGRCTYRPHDSPHHRQTRRNPRHHPAIHSRLHGNLFLLGWPDSASIPTPLHATPNPLHSKSPNQASPGAGLGKYYLMPAALPFLTDKAEKHRYPFSKPPASHTYTYGANTCPNARDFLDNFIRWTTFCEKYQPEHCDLVAQIVATVADQNRV